MEHFKYIVQNQIKLKELHMKLQMQLFANLCSKLNLDLVNIVNRLIDNRKQIDLVNIINDDYNNYNDNNDDNDEDDDDRLLMMMIQVPTTR